MGMTKKALRTRGVGPLAEMGLRAFLGSGFYYHTRGAVFANEGSLGAKCGKLKGFYRVRSARKLGPSFSALSARTPSAQPARHAHNKSKSSFPSNHANILFLSFLSFLLFLPFFQIIRKSRRPPYISMCPSSFFPLVLQIPRSPFI